jgi:hypothetical protein
MNNCVIKREEKRKVNVHDIEEMDFGKFDIDGVVCDEVPCSDTLVLQWAAFHFVRDDPWEQFWINLRSFVDWLVAVVVNVIPPACVWLFTPLVGTVGSGLTTPSSFMFIDVAECAFVVPIIKY